MIKTPIDLQELRRRIYRKAKSDRTHRFWGLFVHVAKVQTLEEAYRIAKSNGGAPGIDGQSFSDIEAAGATQFLEAIREDLLTGRYRPKMNRKVEIPKDNGKVRTLQIPCIRDRVVQGALKQILEAIFEADFCPNSYGFRPKRSQHQALAQVRRSVLRRMSTVIYRNFSIRSGTRSSWIRSQNGSRTLRSCTSSSRSSKSAETSECPKALPSARSRRIST